MIVFDGQSWQLALGASPTWSQIVPSGTPPSGRSNMSAIFDPVRRRMIMFGGFGNSYLNDVWELSLSGPMAWTQLTPSGVAPSPRSGHVAVYDPVRDRMIVFGGGANGNTLFNDVWSLSLSGSPNWAQLSPSGPPPTARAEFEMIYDPVRDRLVLFGGRNATDYLNDVWQLSLTGSPAWAQLSPSGTAPEARQEASAIYDPIRDRMVIFGGLRFDNHFGNFTYTNFADVQSLELGGGASWQLLAPTGSGPTARYAHTAIYDRAGDRMVVYGGANQGNGPTFPNAVFGDTRFLNWGSPASGIDLVPTVLDFGMESQTATRAVTVSNFGSTSVTVSDVACNNPDVAISPTAFTLAPAESRIVTVQWTPTSPGPLSTTVVVTSNAPVNPIGAIYVHGGGPPTGGPSADIVPGSLNYLAPLGVTTTRTAVVCNVGASTLTVSNIASGDPEVTVSAPTAFSLAPGEFRYVPVQWTPATADPLATTVVVSSDDPILPTRTISLSGTVAPMIATTPQSFDVALDTNQSTTRNLRIDNPGGGTLTFTTEEVASALRVPADGGAAETSRGPGAPAPGPLRAGGPDGFGYTYRDSDEPGGPAFSWIDIRATGTQVVSSGDDVTAGFFPIGFPFPFYGNLFTMFRVCSNGWISFTNVTLKSGENLPLPSNLNSVPENLLAVFWDDLIFSGPHIWYESNGERLVIQYQNVGRVGQPGPTNSFEVVLTSEGTILFQYDTMSSSLNSSTIGIMNGTRDVALQVNCNAPYLHSGMAIQFLPPPVDFLTVDPSSGSIEPGGHADLTLTFHSTDLIGDYVRTLRFLSNDGLSSTRDVPCQLTVSLPVGVPETKVERFGLRLAGPNPSAGGTRLELAVAKQSQVTVRVFDVHGALVRELERREFLAGIHPVAWDGTNADGHPARSGVYFVQASGPEGALSQRVVLMR